MKFVALLLFCATSALADFQEIDWSNVVRPEDLPAFWSGKPIGSVTNERNRRIVNGQIATPHQFPYQAAVFSLFGDSEETTLCGGALIHPRNILTAAHCIIFINRFVAQRATVVLGAHVLRTNEPTQQRRVVEREHFRIHPNYTRIGINSDIAVLRLTTAVTLNSQVAVIALPVNNVNQFVGAQATVSGWGRFSDASAAQSTVLRFYRGTVISFEECRRQFPASAAIANICLSGATTGGTCQGDSGGPLSTNVNGVHTHIGVVSFGNRACENPNFASVFARTSSYVNWINANMVR